MASATIRFEVTLPCPNVDSIGQTNNDAVVAFMNGMQALAPCWYYQVSASTGCWYNFYGYITAAQGASALALLATLNSGLSAPWTPVKCVQWSGTNEP